MAGFKDRDALCSLSLVNTHMQFAYHFQGDTGLSKETRESL